MLLSKPSADLNPCFIWARILHRGWGTWRFSLLCTYTIFAFPSTVKGIKKAKCHYYNAVRHTKMILLRHHLSFWRRSFTFNSNKSPTLYNNSSVYYPDACLRLNMFRAFFRPSSGAQWLQWQPLKQPETCWAVNRRQDDKLKNFCIMLMIYLNCTMMHGLTNLKFYI
jgi:hypothetical protein